MAKLGSGGFAKVFLVKRLTDGAKFALKFMEPKSDKERGLIRNELAVMQKCKDNDNVIKCYEAYDYK